MFRELLTDVGGFYRDIKVAEASGVNTGREVVGVRPETVPDQTTVAIPENSARSAVTVDNNFYVGGVAINKNILFATGGVIATLAISRLVG
ncbi:hypothetical protein [Agarilytica rhodophyticola]|uniref:hypothetical protein n=1 Tax=Agarilytica rhodophyticola TaxID=1737490 RepID=UPI000B346A02|nr:hypothetical protein [Agarilytica rhodophyticola]